jgi:heptosyltransferase I
MGPVGIIGGPTDRRIAERMLSLMQKPAANLAGTVPVGLLPALLQSAALLVTNDSGPMHVAAALGTPVVALFGPTSPIRTGPYGAGHVVLEQKLPCRPCFSRRCVNAVEHECLTSITPDQVVTAVRETLKSE